MAELPITTQCGTGAPAAPHLDSGLGRNDEVGGGNDESGDLLSYQSLMPVATGTPRYEKLGALVDGRVQVSSVPRTPPLAGDKPQRYISLATLGCRCSGDGGWCRRPVPEFIPDRSPGHAFVLMTLTRLVPLSLNSYAN